MCEVGRVSSRAQVELVGYGEESLKLIKGSCGKPAGGTSLDPEKKVITISKETSPEIHDNSNNYKLWNSSRYF